MNENSNKIYIFFNRLIDHAECIIDETFYYFLLHIFIFFLNCGYLHCARVNILFNYDVS